MRRLGYGGYGGFGNTLPRRIQPPSLSDRPVGDLPITAPPDIVPRRPSALIEEIVPQADQVAREAIAAAKAAGNTNLESLAAIIKAAVREAIETGYDHMRYADFQSFAFTLAAGVDQTVLERASTKRVYLILFNTGAVNNFNFAFGRSANATDLPLPAQGGFEWLFMIPQNPVHCQSTVGTTGICVFAELPLPANQLTER